MPDGMFLGNFAFACQELIELMDITLQLVDQTLANRKKTGVPEPGGEWVSICDLQKDMGFEVTLD